MITISYKHNGEERVLHCRKEEKEKANRVWNMLSQNPNVTELKGIKEDGSVVFPSVCYAVIVVFNGTNKLYTYGSHKPLNPGDKAIVYTDQIKIVTVVDCKKIEKSALRGLCNNKKPSYILGIATMF